MSGRCWASGSTHGVGSAVRQCRSAQVMVLRMDVFANSCRHAAGMPGMLDDTRGPLGPQPQCREAPVVALTRCAGGELLADHI
eukprot:92428-Chlamydomonas_euryale.AAC.5